MGWFDGIHGFCIDSFVDVDGMIQDSVGTSSGFGNVLS